MKTRKDFFALLLIIFIAFIFRFYNYPLLQHWSGDEELDSSVVRKMVAEKRIVLVRPNPTIATSTGSFFHILSVPLFLISKSNPTSVLLIISLLGIATTALLYKIGSLIKNSRLGFIVSFLYASSFMMSLFDRRWWPITLVPFLSTLAIFSLIKIVVYKKYFYSILLAIPIGFAFHADPALVIVLFTTILSFIYFNVKLSGKLYLLSFFVLSIFVLPFLIFEIRHPGTIVYPLIKNLKSQTQTSGSFHINFELTSLSSTTSVLSRLFFPKETDFAEKYFCHTCPSEEPLFGLFTKMLTFMLILLAFYFLPQGQIKEKKSLILISVFIFSFIIGTLFYTAVFKRWIYQSYFAIIFPVIFLLVGYSLYRLTMKRKVILLLVLIFYLSINASALAYSKLRYPLSIKIKLVENIAKIIGKKDFSLYSLGNEYFYGGGYRGLFILKDKHPNKSNTYSLFDWWYKAHGLYTTNITDKDQELIVIIGPTTASYNFERSKLIYQKSIDNIKGVILDNSDGWFDESIVNNQ